MTGEIDMQAAEYVLGTLSAEERSAFEALMKSDASAQRAVEAWQRRLAPLNVALGEVAPPAHIWHAIAQALAAPSDNMAPVLLLLRRSRNRWRLGALLAGVIAAGLAAFSIDRALIAHNEPQGSYIAVSIAAATSPRSSSASISRRAPFSSVRSPLMCRKAAAWSFGISAVAYRPSRWGSSTKLSGISLSPRAPPSRRRISPFPSSRRAARQAAPRRDRSFIPVNC